MATPSTPSAFAAVHGRFEPGTRLGTRYRIVALLGRGGMGEVYRADDLELGQAVALKFLPPAVATNPAELARFRNEVRVARQIAHPNVCRVYDIGESDGHVFLSMEYIDGEDLAAVLRRMGRPTPDKAVEIARQIAHGLAAAHEAGMLHRDLKPANVMIDGRGRARITDFGLAGLADDLAKDGAIAGTPSYMAPEQLSGGKPSVRSDLYALGLVLYEIFTGKQAYPTGNVVELRRLHQSGTLTTPSSFARDIDPAIERLILHCLENDPDQRPPSAYAVLGALPGGDPLAAAVAAGETPSPELVANASTRGELAPVWVAALVAAFVAALGWCASQIGPDLRVLHKPTDELSVRAADVLGKTGSFGALPRHLADGFNLDRSYAEAVRTERTPPDDPARGLYYWRRWGPRLLESTQIHRENPQLDDPPSLGAGEAAVLLDPDGRLIGLRAVPPDTMTSSPRGVPDWTPLLVAAGIDTASLSPVPPPLPLPAMCDSVAAWSAPSPADSKERVVIQAGASRGRLTWFTTVHDWGRTTAAVDSLRKDPLPDSNWFYVIFFAIIPLFGAVFFGLRNIELGRGDWRGATRIAIFVFVMNMLEGLFATRLSEVGIPGVMWDLFAERAFGHSLIHAVSMWFTYVALEPYVRRLWPRILVSWTRLVSGRLRDPLVGRDLLFGSTAGAALFALGAAVQVFGTRLGWVHEPTMIPPPALTSVVSIPISLFSVAYSGSVCILNVMESFILILLLRLLLRSTWAAILGASLIVVGFGVSDVPTYQSWMVTALNCATYVVGILVLMRLGLLAGVAMYFTGLVLGFLPQTLDFGAWYGDRALVAYAVLLAIVAWGAIAAIGGKSILGDPLRESSVR